MEDGRISMEEGFECLFNFYGKTKDEGQKTARRKRIFRQWKTHGWTESDVLGDEDFEANERAALKELKESEQFLSFLDSSDNEDEEEATENQHENKNESEDVTALGGQGLANALTTSTY